MGTEARRSSASSATPWLPCPTKASAASARYCELLERQFGWFPQREYEGWPRHRAGARRCLHHAGARRPSRASGRPFSSMHDTAAEWRQHMDELHWVGAGARHHLARPRLPSVRDSRANCPGCPSSATGSCGSTCPRAAASGLDMMRRTSTVQANLDYSLRSRRDAEGPRLGVWRSRPIVLGHVREQPVGRAQAHRRAQPQALV